MPRFWLRHAAPGCANFCSLSRGPHSPRSLSAVWAGRMKDFEGSPVHQADGQFHATVAASKGGAESRSAGPCK
jgi:hypothetical protein